MTSQQDASRTLTNQLERMRLADAYSKAIQEADKKALENLQSIMKNGQNSIIWSYIFHGIAYIICLAILGSGIYLMIRHAQSVNRQILSSFLILGGLVLLWHLITTPPTKDIRSSLANLAKINVIYLGFVRHLNQIDATIKYSFQTNDKFTVAEAQEMMNTIQDIIDQTMENISQVLYEME